MASTAHSFNLHSNQTNLAEFTNWLHFLLQEMGMINSQPLLPAGGDHILYHRERCDADGLDGGTKHEFGSCFQLKWNPKQH